VPSTGAPRHTARRPSLQLHLRNHNLCAILACVQATSIPSEQGTSATAAETGAGPTAGATTETSTIPLADDLYALVVYLHKRCNSDLFEALGTLELTLTQIKLLHYLEDADQPQTLKEAAELVHLSLPAASRTVDDLVRRGFVERHEDMEDRRMKRVSLTPAGAGVSRRTRRG
jgi:DNA-binding MarR family transcriptional regulator